MPSDHSLSPRAQALLTRIESWSDAGPVRAVVVKVMVTIGGPLVIALGFALLALEYAWARHALGLLGHGLGRVKDVLFPREGSPTRKLVGLVATAGFLVATTALTSAVTALIGSQALA